MSVLFINEENLPRVDALVTTDNTQASDNVYISVEMGDLDTLDRYSFIGEVVSFFTHAITEASLRGYSVIAIPFPTLSSRRAIDYFLKIDLLGISSRFDVDVYITVTDRQRRMIYRVVNIDDELYPKMYSRKISTDFDSKIKRKRAEVDYCCSIEPGEVCEEAVPSLVDFIRDMDDTFAVRLLKLIDRKGMNEIKCYKAANVSRQTWYKIMNEGDYRPSKNTVISFAIALRLDYSETQALLATAGYTLSHSILFDRIIAYCLENSIYDVFMINAMLYSYDLECLGS